MRGGEHRRLSRKLGWRCRGRESEVVVMDVEEGAVQAREGVGRRGGDPAKEQSSTIPRKVLLHTLTNEVIRSYASLDSKLLSLGWERYCSTISGA